MALRGSASGDWSGGSPLTIESGSDFPIGIKELASFAPLAFGREIVQQSGVTCSDLYRLHNLADGTEKELPLVDELAYAWARAMIGLHRIAERNEVFKLLAERSAELDAVNYALNGGVSAEELRASRLGPPVVYLHRLDSSDDRSDA